MYYALVVYRCTDPWGWLDPLRSIAEGIHFFQVSWNIDRGSSLNLGPFWGLFLNKGGILYGGGGAKRGTLIQRTTHRLIDPSSRTHVLVHPQEARNQQQQ